MRILVTGATGFLGYHIAQKLKEEGHEVTNFSRSSTAELELLGIPTIKGNLNSLDSIKSALSGIEAVFHVAGKVGMWGKWKDYYEINFLGTKNLVDSMKELNIKYLVYTSTPSVVFGKEEIIAGDETLDHATNSLSLYAKSKSLAEKYVLEQSDQKLFTTAIRPHLIYGERDRNIIPRLITAKKKGKLKAIGDRTNLVDIIYVENAADAHTMALTELLGEAKNQGRPYFIGQEKPVNLWEFIDSILVSKGLTKIDKEISLKLAYNVGAVIEFFLKVFKIYNIHPPMTRFVALQLGSSHYFSHENARRDFGYIPKISTKESLKRITKV